MYKINIVKYTLILKVFATFASGSNIIIMIRKIIASFSLILVLASGAFALPVDYSNIILGCISRTVTSPSPDYTRISALSTQCQECPPEVIDAVFRDLMEAASRNGDERIQCAAATFAGIYYLNSSDFGHSLQYFSTAYGYSHQACERDYLDYLKSACFAGMGRYDMVAPSLENIMSYDLQSADRFSKMLYCESLRLMSLYHSSLNHEKLALKLLNEYCAISDTLVCGSIQDAIHILPENLRSRYYERRAVAYYTENIHKESDTAGKPSVPVTLAFMLSLGFLGISYKIVMSRIRAGRKSSLSSPPAETSSLSEPELVSLLNQSSRAISVVDADGHLSWVNKSFEKLYGYTRDEFILAFGNNAFVIGKIDGRYQAFDKCMVHKTAQSSVSKIRTGHNTDIWINSMITPVLDGGEIVKYVVEDMDVSTFKNETKAVSIINSQLQASLRNASEIQRMLMPSRINISRHFDNFVTYSPKDFVSGDFYWYHEIDGAHYFAVGDCTGHGPSASLLCVLSTKSIDDIVLSRGITNPCDILTALDESIIASLRQKDAVNCDGLDITVCRICPTPDGADVTVSGAQSYFIYHANGQTNLLKGAKRSIGGIIDFQLKHHFENSELQLPHGARLYMTSDGIIDQNNTKRRSLGSRRFCDIIHQSANMPMQGQQNYIDQAVREWAEGEPQRDDICLLGIEIR